jgi:hypothetical protein
MTRRELLYAVGAAVAATRPTRPAGAQPPPSRPVPKSEFDYIDWSWARWRAITGATRPEVERPQAGRPELLDLLNPAAASPAPPWRARRADILSVLRELLGTPPAASAPLDARTVGEERTATHLRRRVTFRAGTGEAIPALLLLPRTLRGRVPAVLCPHQTTQEGKREPAGLAGNPEQFTARRLAERGYVALTWDAIGFGERHDAASGHYGDAIPFYEAHPQWSFLGKMVADLSRAIDYLSALDFVDATRISCIGHSHGAITTIFGMALDERIAAGAANCGFDTFRIDGNVFRWSHATALLPRLGFFVGSPYVTMDMYRGVPDSEVIRTPFDLHEVLALSAPRPLLLTTSDDDFVFPNAGWSVRQSLRRLRPVYNALAAGDRLDAAFFTGGHRLPHDIAARAYAWLDRWLEA